MFFFCGSSQAFVDKKGWINLPGWQIVQHLPQGWALALGRKKDINFYYGTEHSMRPVSLQFPGWPRQLYHDKNWLPLWRTWRRDGRWSCVWLFLYMSMIWAPMKKLHCSFSVLGLQNMRKVYEKERLKQNWSFPQPGYGFALEHCIGKHTRGWFLVFAACNPNLSCRAVPCCTAWPSGIKGTMTKWTECQQGCSVTVWQAAQVAPCGLVCYCLLQWRHQGRAKAREDPFSAIPYPSPENMTLFWQLMSD